MRVVLVLVVFVVVLVVVLLLFCVVFVCLGFQAAPAKRQTDLLLPSRK